MLGGTPTPSRHSPNPAQPNRNPLPNIYPGVWYQGSAHNVYLVPSPLRIPLPYWSHPTLPSSHRCSNTDTAPASAAVWVTTTMAPGESCSRPSEIHQTRSPQQPCRRALFVGPPWDPWCLEYVSCPFVPVCVCARARACVAIAPLGPLLHPPTILLPVRPQGLVICAECQLPSVVTPVKMQHRLGTIYSHILQCDLSERLYGEVDVVYENERRSPFQFSKDGMLGDSRPPWSASSNAQPDPGRVKTAPTGHLHWSGGFSDISLKFCRGG